MLKKQPKLLIIILVCIFAVGIIGIVALQGNRREHEFVEVVASFYPLGEFTSNLIATGGVTTLVPEGMEPHDYEPSPQDIATITRANLLIYNGNGFEPWVEDFLLTEEGRNTKALNISQHVDLLEGDPHFWLDPVIAEQITEVIAAELKNLDPSQSTNIDERLSAYKNELQLLDQSYREGLANCQQTKIIVSHDAFNYPALRYNFETVEISGISPEEEPTPQKLAEITQLAKQEKIEYIFFESLINPALAETIAREVGAKTLVLNPIENITEEERLNGENYLTIMRNNLANLRLAMQCQ